MTDRSEEQGSPMDVAEAVMHLLTQLVCIKAENAHLHSRIRNLEGDAREKLRILTVIAKGAPGQKLVIPWRELEALGDYTGVAVLLDDRDSSTVIKYLYKRGADTHGSG